MKFQLKETAYPHNPTTLGIVVGLGQIALPVGLLILMGQLIFSAPSGQSQYEKAKIKSMQCTLDAGVQTSGCDIKRFQ